MDVDWDSPMEDTEFYLDVQLKFHQVKIGGSSAAQAKEARNLAENAEFETPSHQTFRILGATKGVTEFIPVTFGKHFFSLTHMSLHSSLIQFKWTERKLYSAEFIREYYE